MESNVNISKCEFEAELVSYLYDELNTTKRDRFETHLLDCTPCTDEFAELSFSRFSVFEWQKEEFAPLKTPAIVIPYPATQTESPGFFAGLREILAFNWQTGVTVAGALIVCVGLGFIALNYAGRNQQTVAGIENTKTNSKIVLPVASPVVPKDVPVTVAVDKQPKDSSVRETQPAKIAVEVRKVRTNRPATINAPRVANDPAERPKERKAPALTADTDDDDKSLRLADLFDTVDSRL